MPKLNAVEFGFNKYCGPSVLSILTGKSTDECARVIGGINGQYNVQGVTIPVLLSAARKLGFNAEDMHLGEMSLYRALVAIAPKGNAQYIVWIGTHLVCIEVADKKLYFCDNHTREPIPAASSARLSMPVISVHKVSINPNFREKPKWVRVSMWACPVCSCQSFDANLIIHTPECKWRGYVPDSDSDETR